MPIYNPVSGGGGGTTITTQDEGATLSSTVNTLNFVGAGVVASGAGATTTVTIAGGAGASWSETEVDFGSSPNVRDAELTVTDAAVTGTSKIIVVPSGSTATGRSRGDGEWDNISYSAKPNTGTFTLYASSANGALTGKRKILYTVA